MLSPSKILLTIAVIVVVVFATRFLRGRSVARSAGGTAAKAEPPADAASVDLEACAVCGDYVDAAAPGCGRENCPRPAG